MSSASLAEEIDLLLCYGPFLSQREYHGVDAESQLGLIAEITRP
ncbi:uncharacterized protein METZ01_LOCUS304190, partial [marine metagenome]